MKNEQTTPCGWSLATIEDLIPVDGLFKDGDWVESKDQDPEGEVRLIQLADIGDGYFVDKSDRHLTKSKAYQLNCTFLKYGDLLVARMPDPLGRCCLFPLSGSERFVTVVDVCVIRLAEASVEPRYLMHLINSAQIRTKIGDRQSGSTRKRISRGNLAAIELPIAPLKEQRRIVAKIEELFSELDKGIENLRTAREQLKAYRQAVLNHAFEGKLTVNWRESYANELQDPEDLLAIINEERQERYQQQLQEWKTAPNEGDAESRSSKPKPPGTIQAAEMPKSGTPSSWSWIELGNLNSEIFDGPFGSNLKTSDYVGHGIRVIRLENIGYLRFIEEKRSYITPEKYDSLKRHTVKRL